MSDLCFLALDLSQTSTGVALWFEGEIPETKVLKNGKEGPERLVWIRDQIRDLTLNWVVRQPNLVILEGYDFGTRHGAHHAGELGGIVRVDLWEHGIPYVLVSPSQLKKYATGRGNASKSEVLQVAVHRFGRTFKTDDEADARWLLDMALARYGLPHVRMPAPNRAVLDKITWPVLTALEVPA